MMRREPGRGRRREERGGRREKEGGGRRREEGGDKMDPREKNEHTWHGRDVDHV
jgi:hypothetical protein